MSYQQGYPQQQPQGAWQGGGYPTAGGAGEGGGTNPATAIIAAILGLAAAAALVVVNLNVLDKIPSGADIPGEFMTMIILRFAAAAIALIGAVIVFVRKLAGAIVLALGAVVAIAAILLEPVVLSDAVPSFGEYFEAMFKFEDVGRGVFSSTYWTFLFAALVASPLALIFSIVPPTLNYLKGSGSAGYDGYGGYPQQPQQQGW